MRKIFTFLTMCMLASMGWATVITFDATVDTGTGSGTAGAFQIVKEAEGVQVTVSVTNGIANGSQYRFYKNEKVTISAEGGTISKIEFTCTAQNEAQYGPGCFVSDLPTYTYSGNIGTWEGESPSVVFTASTAQVRATLIKVTVGAAGLSAPYFTPASGTFYDPFDVTIACRTSGAKIYYTTDGSNPTTSSSQYTSPIRVSNSMTIKAISALDGDVSEVVSAEYVMASAVGVADIAEYSSKPDGTIVKFLNPVYVSAQNGRYLYIQDNSGYGLVYGTTNQTYELGDRIPAGFVGTKTTYSEEPELTDPTNFQAAAGNIDIAPENATTAMVDHEHWAHYVYFSRATIDPEAKTLTDAVGTAPVYFSMGVTASQVTAGNEYEVWAVIGSYKPTDGNVVYQILPVKVKRIVSGDDGVGIGKMGEYDDNTMLEFEYDAKVLYHGNSRLFVKDVTGFGLIYGNVGQTYKQGDIISAGYGGKKTTYGGEPELATPFTGFQAATVNDTLIAEPSNPLLVNHEHFAHYVVMTNVDVIELSGNNFKVKDASGNICNGYNQFGQDIHEGHYEELYGIVGSYGATNTVYQLLPIVKAPLAEVNSINELYQLNSGRQAHFNTPLTAIYQNRANLYVKDNEGTYSLVYGSLAYTEFVNGDYINDAVASWSTYQGNKQLIPDGSTFVKAGHGTPVEPEFMPIEEVSQDMVHWFLGFENVTIVEEDGKYYMEDETGRLLLFDRFGTIPENVTQTNPHYVEGFLTVYNDELEFYPSLIDGINDCGKKGDVNNDGEINIADINALIDIILGAEADDCTKWRADVAEDNEIGIADVNALIDLIFSLTD